MKKKVFALLLCGAMAVGTLAGCGSTSTETSKPAESSAAVNSSAASNATPESSVSVEEPEEPVSITWLPYYTNNFTIAKDSWVELILEEYFNLDITAVDNVNAENFSLMLASGDLEDVTCWPVYFNGDYVELYDQGVIRDIPEEWLWEYYPTGMKNLSDYFGDAVYEDGYHLNDGKVLHIPYFVTANRAERVMLYRKDWLENLGLEEPTTLDEFHDMLYAFTYDDPDGNGQDDTYGMDETTAELWPIFGAFGISSTGYTYIHDDDGTVRLNATSEEYRQALGIIHEWYTEGIIDPESITDNRDNRRAKWASGKIGAMSDQVTWCLTTRGSSAVIPMVEDVYGEGTVGRLGQMTTEYGDGYVYSIEQDISTSGTNSMVFMESATDEQVIAVLKMLEGICKDPELAIKVIYGEEGVDFTWNGDRIAVNPDLTVEGQAAKGLAFGVGGFGAINYDEYIQYLACSEADVELYNFAKEQKSVYIQNGFPVSTPNEARDTYGGEVSKLVGEYFFNVTVGKSNLESDWDAYLANLSAAGLDKILAEYEAALN